MKNQTGITLSDMMIVLTLTLPQERISNILTRFAPLNHRGG